MLEKLGRFIDWVWSFPVALFNWLQDAFNSAVGWIEGLPAWVFYKFSEGVVSFFNAIPVPDFFYEAGGALNSIPSEVVYFAAMFRLDFGVTVVLVAFLIRFVIRRIPLIG